ncbi:MAG: S8/S53 family peptidase [Acidobacteriota bacterium]
MTKRYLIHTLTLALLAGMILGMLSCKPPVDNKIWLAELFEKGRGTFYQTIQEKISVHPERSCLTEAEITKIMELETHYDRSYGLLVNIFFQKDEPTYRMLLTEGRRKSKERFTGMYLELVRFSANNFVECFFLIDWTTAYARETYDEYKDLDAVDLVVRSIGYHAKLDIPEREMFVNKLSPEFDKQDTLEAAGFPQALQFTRGKGVKIAVLDTGIDESHSIFRNTRWGMHFSLVGREGPPWDTDITVIDWGFHGTAISSICARYSPEAQLTMYKFSDGNTQNNPAYLLLMECMLAGNIYKAVHDGNDIISISASGASLDADYLREAVKYAYENNRIVISGNLYSKWFKEGNILNFPGQYETVISVTAAERKKNGTYGYWDVCAPDETTSLAVPNEIFGAFPVYMEENDAYIPSISAAVPVIASLFALTISIYPPEGTEGPGEYADTLMKLILDNAEPEAVGLKGFSPECGYGLINARGTQKNNR